MPGTAIGISMNLGYPGTVSRPDALIASRAVTATDATGPNFGDPLVLIPNSTGGTLSSVAAYTAAGNTFTAAKFAGVAVREVKVNNSYIPQNTLTSYLPGQICDAIERGSVSVTCNVGTPVSGGQVYVRIALNGSIPAGVIGGYEAAADGTNTVALPYTVFRTGAIDANNTTEITLTNRVAA